MDLTRFDSLTRHLGSTTPRQPAGHFSGSLTRRQGLTGLGAALAGLLGLPGLVTAQEATAKRCLRNGTRCHRRSGGGGDPCRRCCSGHSKPRTGGKGRRCAAAEVCDVCPTGCPYSRVQDAIIAAAPGATIRLCARTYRGTITIDKDVTLVGARRGDTTLDGTGGDTTVVDVGAGVTVALRHLTITGGNNTSSSGGGIYNAGSLSLRRVTVSRNTAGFGGGIYHEGTMLRLTDSTVAHNRASRGGGIDGGGLIEASGCTFNNNRATNGGGALFNLSFGQATLRNCEITGNRAGADGGGVHNTSQGGVRLEDGTRISGNHAGGDGGGVFNTSLFTTIACDGTSTITGNTAGDSPVPSNCVDAAGATGCDTCEP